MKTLSQQSSNFGEVGANAQEAKRYFDSEIKGDEEIDEKIGALIKVLWADSGIQVPQLHYADQLLRLAVQFAGDVRAAQQVPAD